MNVGAGGIEMSGLWLAGWSGRTGRCDDPADSDNQSEAVPRCVILYIGSESGVGGSGVRRFERFGRVGDVYGGEGGSWFLTETCFVVVVAVQGSWTSQQC
jgi:hypothetical protein